MSPPRGTQARDKITATVGPGSCGAGGRLLLGQGSRRHRTRHQTVCDSSVALVIAAVLAAATPAALVAIVGDGD